MHGRAMGGVHGPVALATSSVRSGAQDRDAAGALLFGAKTNWTRATFTFPPVQNRKTAALVKYPG